jgi:hypothetical protein
LSTQNDSFMINVAFDMLGGCVLQFCYVSVDFDMLGGCVLQCCCGWSRVLDLCTRPTSLHCTVDEALLGEVLWSQSTAASNAGQAFVWHYGLHNPLSLATLWNDFAVRACDVLSKAMSFTCTKDCCLSICAKIIV